MKKTLLVLLLAVMFTPLLGRADVITPKANAAAVINRYGQSMCKSPADIRPTSGASFSGQTSANVPAGQRVSVRAIAANTGDTSANVGFQIHAINPNTPSTSHQFEVSVNGTSNLVTVYSPTATTISLNASYHVYRTDPDTLTFGDIGNTESVNYLLQSTEPSSGASSADFGASYNCTPPNGQNMPYGWFSFANNPVNQNFEQGLINVYDVIGPHPCSQNCDPCNNCNPPPCDTCNHNYGTPVISASPDFLYPGETTYLTWSGGNGAVSCHGNWNNYNDIGTYEQGRPYGTSPSANPNGTQVFSIQCSYPDGSSKSASTSIQFHAHTCTTGCCSGTCTPPPPPPCSNCNNLYLNPVDNGIQSIAGSPIVKTLTPALDIQKTSATIRGSYNANGCPAMIAWFEWGADKTELDHRSASVQQPNAFGSLRLGINNLRPNTRIYYRIVGSNCKGTSFGSIESFITLPKFLPSEIIYEDTSSTDTSTTTHTTSVSTVKKATTVAKSSSMGIGISGAGTSYLALDVTNDNDDTGKTVYRGDTVKYRVIWNNLTKSILHDGKVRINLPEQLTFVSTSRGLYDASSNSIYIAVGDIGPLQGDTVNIETTATTTGEIGSPVVVEAIAAFDAPGSDAQVNAIDYDEDILGDRQAATAAARVADTGSVNGLLGIGWFGWIIIALILILVFLVGRYYTLVGMHQGGAPVNNYYSAPPTGYSTHNAVAPSPAPTPVPDLPIEPPAPSGGAYQPYKPQ